jgi:hypothetical protein
MFSSIESLIFGHFLDCCSLASKICSIYINFFPDGNEQRDKDRANVHVERVKSVVVTSHARINCLQQRHMKILVYILVSKNISPVKSELKKNSSLLHVFLMAHICMAQTESRVWTLLYLYKQYKLITLYTRTKIYVHAYII